MPENDWLTQQFEDNRNHLRGVAYRMLASASDAEDAVQEVWLRLIRSDANGIENMRGWLTTVVARVSLDMLRSRKSRQEDPLEPFAAESIVDEHREIDPAYEAELADSVGVALLVVLDRLAPAERLSFVLHDMFALPFNEIAPIVGCSPAAARQLASRARRRVHGSSAVPTADLKRQHEIATAFLMASRGGDFDALLAVLDPDVVLRADASAAPQSGSENLGGSEIRGAQAVAGRAKSFSDRAPASYLALVDGKVGVIVAPRGRLMLVLALTIEHEKIVEIDVITDPSHLRQLDLAVFDDRFAREDIFPA